MIFFKCSNLLISPLYHPCLKFQVLKADKDAEFQKMLIFFNFPSIGVHILSGITQCKTDNGIIINNKVLTAKIKIKRLSYPDEIITL